MDISKLIKRVKDVIYPNGVKAINAQEHQALIIELLEVYNIGKANTEHKHSIDDIDDFREVVEDIESSIKKDIEDIKINNSILKKELDATKEALKIVSSGDEIIKSKGNPVLLPYNTKSSVANSYQINSMSISNFIEGAKSVNATQKVTSIGVNLISTKLSDVESGYYFDENGNPSDSSKDFIRTKPTKFNFSGKVFIESNLKVYTVHCFGKNKWLGMAFASSIDKSYNIPKGTDGIRISLHNTSGKADTSAFEFLNVTRTEPVKYKLPYQVSHLYINSNVELRSMMNVRDVIRDDEFVQKVGVINAVDISGVSSIRLSGDIVLFSISTVVLQTTPYPSVIIRDNKNGITFSKVDTPGAPTKAYTYYGWQASIEMAIPASELSDVTNQGALKYIRDNDYTFEVVLKDTVITPIQTSGQLVLKPNGTVFSEPIKMGVEIYDNGIKTSMPIVKVESLAKFDMDTGNDVEVDKSKAIISDKKLTHPDLKDGDMVFLEYFYDDNPITPELEIEFFNSDRVLEDKTTGDLYSWGIEVDNGEVKLVSNKVANKIETEE